MRTAKRLLTGLLATCWISGLTGCLHPATKVLDPNTATVRVLKATPYTPPGDGYFVPDAKMLELLDRLSEKDVFAK